jgi:hypothetical protein
MIYINYYYLLLLIIINGCTSHSQLTIFELRGEWRRLHRAPPPMRLSRDLLRRGITYKLQERGRSAASPNRSSASWNA